MINIMSHISKLLVSFEKETNSYFRIFFYKIKIQYHCVYFIDIQLYCYK